MHCGMKQVLLDYIDHLRDMHLSLSFTSKDELIIIVSGDTSSDNKYLEILHAVNKLTTNPISGDLTHVSFDLYICQVESYTKRDERGFFYARSGFIYSSEILIYLYTLITGNGPIHRITFKDLIFPLKTIPKGETIFSSAFMQFIDGLEKTTTLKSLVFDSCRLSKTEFDYITLAIVNNKTKCITELKHQVNFGNRDDYDRLRQMRDDYIDSNIVNLFNSMKVLEISPIDINRATFISLGDLLRTNVILTELNITFYDYYKFPTNTTSMIEPLMEGLKSNDVLRKLKLRHGRHRSAHDNMQKKQMKSIYEMLKVNRAIEKLELECIAGKLSFKYLLKALSINKSLTHLSLDNNFIFHGETWIDVFFVDKDFCITANEIDQLIVELINSNITHFSMNYNNIMNEGATKFTNVLKANQLRLQSLSLNNNSIDDIGAARFAEALETNTILSKLSLENKSTIVSGRNTEIYRYYIHIKRIGMESLARALLINKTLTCLNLNGNRVYEHGNREVIHVDNTELINMLKNNTTLKELYLDDNTISILDAIEITHGLWKNRGLEIFSAKDNNINIFSYNDPEQVRYGEVFAGNLREVILSNPVLRNINITSSFHAGNSWNIENLLNSIVYRLHPFHLEIFKPKELFSFNEKINDKIIEEKLKREYEEQVRQNEIEQRIREEQLDAGDIIELEDCPSRKIRKSTLRNKEVCREYKRLVLEVHPDRNKGCIDEANEKFKLLGMTCPDKERTFNHV
jgi:hypothetical protein